MTLNEREDKISIVVNKILNGYTDKPQIVIGFNGIAVELRLKGGSFIARNRVFTCLSNSKDFKHVDCQNYETSNRMTFYLKEDI